MIKKFLPLLLLSMLFGPQAFSQLTEDEQELIAPSYGFSRGLNYFVEFNLKGVASTRDRLPFWLYHNQRGRISADTDAAAWLTAKRVLFLSPRSYFIFGAGVLYQNGTSEGLVADELFAHFQNTWMYATVGRKQQPELYNGLSASNKSILWSLNARPLPGLQIGTAGPVFPFPAKHLGFEASWDEFWMGNDRYTKGARLHHKNFRFVYRYGSWQVKAGLQHFVQWDGFTPGFGPQPDDFNDYLRVVTGQAGLMDATVGDQLNKLGNVVGGYELYVRKVFEDFQLQFFYNHLLEDGTGTRMVNKPDGRYGIFYEHEEKNRFVNAIIYELYYTKNQSYTTLGNHKYDNYFNNGVYRSGWTYEDRVLGAPFFTPDPDDIGIANNKFMAHHLGIGGRLSNYYNALPYQLLLSYARNHGRYHERYRPKQDVIYGLFNLSLLQQAVKVNLQLGVEYNSYTGSVFGAGVHLLYKI